MALSVNKFTAGDIRMKSWNVLIETIIQGAKIQGTITCHTTSEESAKKLAVQTFINQLRRAGIWAYINKVDEPYEVEVEEGSKDKATGKPTKKKEIRYRKITKYYAPYEDHVKVIEIIDLNSRDLTFPVEELEEAIHYARGISAPKPKRKTTGEATLNGRKKKQTLIVKKEKQFEKKQKAEANKQSKEELLRVVEEYFTCDEAKIIKVAAGELNQTYQRVRYALFQIKDKGYNNTEYDLIQSKVDDSTAFRLINLTKS